jgi:ATP-dependent RNA helicase DDX27
MLLKKSQFFEELEDNVYTHDWSFKNSNVSNEIELPVKRKRKDVVLQESDVSFGELGLSKPLTKACSDLGFLNPTSIQEQVIPLVLKGSDIIICAKTGSGKTGAFSLPILHKLLHRTGQSQATRCIILSPTRELCQQTYSMIENYTKYTDLVCRVVIGGANSLKEQKQLQDSPEILIGTPGRVLDHIKNTKDISFDFVEFLVLDEADRLLDMGFTAELKEILKEIPNDRQTVLASATIDEKVKDLVQLALKKPLRVGKEELPEHLHQVIVRMKPEWAREAVVLYLIEHQAPDNVIVFCKTKSDCHKMFLILKQLGKNAAELHGRLPQSSRLKSLQDFQNGTVRILVATDLASRGLDLPIETVINMHIPEEINKLRHRIGRTARAGQQGISISLCNDEERTLIRKSIKKNNTSLSLDKQKLEECTKTLENVMSTVKQIIKDEIVDKEMQKAEMEANKANNFIDHADEIYNKPKKEWIHKDKHRGGTQENKINNAQHTRELQAKIMRHKLMLQNYKNATKGVKLIEKHVEKSRKPKKSKSKNK